MGFFLNLVSKETNIAHDGNTAIDRISTILKQIMKQHH
jgi:hypothetical protein